MATNLSQEELREFQEIFNLVDSDKTGRITQQEFRSLMDVLRLKPTEDEVAEMFSEARGTSASGFTRSKTHAAAGGSAAAAEMDGIDAATAPTTPFDGTIDFPQFVSIMAKRVESSYSPEQLRGAFHLFETDDVPSGCVATEVLEHALMTFGTERLTQEEAARLLSTVDPENTGVINYNDFVDLISGVRRGDSED